MSESDIDSVIKLDDHDFYDTPACIHELESVRAKIKKAYGNAKPAYDKTVRNKSTLIKDIFQSIKNKDNHKDTFWLEQTRHLDKVYLQELPPFELKQVHDDLMDYENKKKKYKHIVTACSKLKDSIQSEAKKNIELRHRLHLQDSNIEYDKLIGTPHKGIDLNALKIALSECNSQLTDDNDTLNNNIQERIDFLVNNIKDTYKKNIALAEKINLYLDFSYDEHREYREVFTPDSSQSLDVLENQYRTITEENELLQKDIEKYRHLYSELDDRKEVETVFAEKAQTEVTKIIKDSNLTAFNKPSSQLLRLLKQELYSGTVEYDREHLADIKRGKLAKLDHFLNKGPHSVKMFQPTATTQSNQYIERIKNHFDKQNNVNIQFIPLGGGNEIGGSCNLFLYKTPHKTFSFLVDIGIRNLRGGFRHPDLKMLTSYGIAQLSDLDGIFITHAHADHIGALFDLIIRPQIQVPLYMSAATKDIFQAITLDGIKFMAEHQFTDISKAEWKTRIKQDDKSFSGNIITVESKVPIDIIPGEFVMTPYHAGHVIGALGFLFDIVKLNKRILFTGDFTLRPLKSVTGADFLDIKKVDTIICEGTNLSKLNVRSLDSYKTFADKLFSTISNGGRVVIPAFSIGKAQEIISLLVSFQTSYRKKFTIKIDGLAKRITEIYSQYSNKLNSFEFSNSDNADIIVSSSGLMKENTAIEDHLKSIFSDNKSLLIKGSFFDEEYSGWASNYQLNAVKDIEYGGQHFKLKCEIYDFKIPLHAELYEIENLINLLKPKSVQFVHTLSSLEHNIVPSFEGDTEIGWPKNFESVALFAE